MPRAGSSCAESVLRVPKETSLRMEFSMLRALISETMRAIAGLRRAAGTILRCACALGACAQRTADRAKKVNEFRDLRTELS